MAASPGDDPSRADPTIGDDPPAPGDYDFGGLADDVMEIVDLPSAVMSSLGWSALVPVLVGLLFFFRFLGEMPLWVLVPFALVAVILSLVAAVLLGVFVVTRRRFEACRDASGRVLHTLGRVHGDLARARSAEVTHAAVNDLAVGFLRSGVLEDSVIQFIPPPASYVAKPLVRPLVWGPRRVIEKTVTTVVDSMPWDRLDQLVAAVTDGVDEQGQALAGIQQTYDDAQAKVEGTMQKMIGPATTPLLFLFVFFLVPVLFWYLLGVLFT